LRVYDIFAEAADYLGTNDQTYVFRTLTRAVEYLANKGDWDVLKGYVDLPVQNRNLVVLPWQVETPLKFTVDDVPAFSRDRLYEFTLNGFGSNPGSDRIDTSWEDRGFVPTSIVPAPSPAFYVMVGPSVAADFGKKVLIRGVDANNVEQGDRLTIDTVNYIFSTRAYAKLTEINKDRTLSSVKIYSAPSPPSPVQWTVHVADDPNFANNEDLIKIIIVEDEVTYGVSYTTTGGQTLDQVLDQLVALTWPPGISVTKDTANGNLVFAMPGGGQFTVTDAYAQWTPPPLPSGPGPHPSYPVPANPTVTTRLARAQVSQTLPPSLVLLADYHPNELDPRYRMIRLPRTGVRARFLFRRKTFQITSMDDFIPVQSQLGLLTMVQAIQSLRRKDFEVAKASADAAVEITTDAQRATTGFIELANNTESQAARNYRIYNRDSVIVMDVFDDVAKILGNVGEDRIFDAITTGLEVLCAKGHWDGFTGYVDIRTDGWRNVTLPRFVDQPIEISINGQPSYMRNKWSEFHLNGPGSDEYGGQWMGGVWPTWSGFSGGGRWGQIRAWDVVGDVCTIKPLGCVSQLVAIPDDIIDDGKTITIYGYDETGKWIRTNGRDGFVVTTDHNKLVPVIDVDQRVARIVRITREHTSGFVRLWAFDDVTQTTSVLLGYYYPDETEPRYYRIKLPTDAKWIRLRYRKRTLRVESVWQPLHLYSRMAIVTMVRALKALDSDAGAAQVMEDKATRFLAEDQAARNPGETFQLQINEDCGWNSNYIVS
jgi:hypothetical protein